jgi:hypothetical protein
MNQWHAEVVSISCQTEAREKEIVRLSRQPPFEIFWAYAADIQADKAPGIAPSERISGAQQCQPATQLLARSGELMLIPPIALVGAETHSVAAVTTAQFAIGKARDLSKQLQLAVSELQAIEHEGDRQKRAQLKRTLGITLDIERDGIVSEMRERINQLEQMVKRLSEGTAEAEGQGVRVSVESDAPTMRVGNRVFQTAGSVSIPGITTGHSIHEYSS